MTAFVFDLDGTICFKGQPLQTDILAAFEQLEEDGHEVVFASARPIRDMYPVLPKYYWHHRMIDGNGAFIFKCMLFTEDEMIFQSLETMDCVIHRHQKEGILDISPKSRTKTARYSA